MINCHVFNNRSVCCFASILLLMGPLSTISKANTFLLTASAPSTGVGDIFGDFETLTLVVAPDPALIGATGNDALIEYATAFSVYTPPCTYGGPVINGYTCYLSFEDQALGPGILFAVGGDEWYGGNNVDEIGQQFGTIGLLAGTYEFNVEAFVSYSPSGFEVLPPDLTETASTTLTLTVAGGDVSIAPEPSQALSLVFFAFATSIGFWVRRARSAVRA